MLSKSVSILRYFIIFLVIICISNSISKSHTVIAQTAKIEKKDQESLKINPLELEARKEAFTNIIKVSKEIANNLNSKDSIRVIRTLENAHLGIPLPDSVFSIGLSKDEINSFTLALVMKDEDLKGEFEALATYDFICATNMPARSLVFDNRMQLSDFCKGIIIAVETLSFLEKSENKISEFEAIKIMIKAQHEILTKIGKEPYQKLIYSYSTKIATDLLKSDNPRSIIDNMMPDTDIYFYPADLDEIFGKALSQKEISIRFMFFWTHCYFSLIDEMQNSPKVTNKDFANKLKEIYIYKLFSDSSNNPHEKPLNPI